MADMRNGLEDQVTKLLSSALEKNEFPEFLLGNGVYHLLDMHGASTDRSMALRYGVYAYCRRNPESGIGELFAGAITKLAGGSLFELMSAFDYCWLQVGFEAHGLSPFVLKQDCFSAVRAAVLSNAERLRRYKKYPEFGGELPQGAYDLILSLDEQCFRDYGRRVVGLKEDPN